MDQSSPWWMPKIAIVGWGRAGKDVAGAWFGENTLLRYVGSTSMIIAPLIAAECGLPVEEAWANRHKERKKWYDWANEYRKDDPAKLIKKTLEHGDIVVGLRDIAEMRAMREQRLVDLVIWMDRNVPRDPTVTYGEEWADVIINNDGTLEDLYVKLTNLCGFARLPMRKYDQAHTYWPTATIAAQAIDILARERRKIPYLNAPLSGPPAFARP